MPPPKPSLPPGAQQPNMTGSMVQPDTNAGTIRAIDVPAGKTFDQVALPPGTIATGKDGIGQVVVDIKVVDNTRTDVETVAVHGRRQDRQTLTPELVEIMRERLQPSACSRRSTSAGRRSPPAACASSSGARQAVAG